MSRPKGLVCVCGIAIEIAEATDGTTKMGLRRWDYEIGAIR